MEAYAIIAFAFVKTPHISLSCRLVPVHYGEHDTGLFELVIMNLDLGLQ